MLQKRVSKEYISFEEVKFSSQAFSVGEIGSIVVEQFLSALLQVLHFAYLKIYLLQLSLQMLILFAYSLLPEKMSA